MNTEKIKATIFKTVIKNGDNMERADICTKII